MIGGGPAVRAVVDDFYRRVLAVARLAPFFTGVDLPRLKGHQARLVTKVLGGPDTNRGRPLAEAHARLGITTADFAQVISHLVAALEHAGVPQDVIGRAGTVVVGTEPEIVRA